MDKIFNLRFGIVFHVECTPTKPTKYLSRLTSSFTHKKLFCMLQQMKYSYYIFIYKMVQTLAQPQINKESLTKIAIKTKLKCPKMIWSWNAHNRFTLNPFLGELFLHSFFYFTFELFNTNTLSVQKFEYFFLGP